MRAIDADALEKEGWSLHRTIQVDKNTSEYQTKPLRKVPTIEPEPHWIKCSERLPDKPDGYPHCGIYRTYFLVSLESGCVKTLAYEFDRDEWQITGSPVEAWMPLPEPYREESDE